MSAKQTANWKNIVQSVLEGTHPRFGRSITFILQSLIVISVLSIGVETLPDLSDKTRKILAASEVIIVAVFTAEYLLRLCTAERPSRYFFSFWGAIDLVAILPFYLSWGIDLRAARALRLLRLFRLLKMARYSEAIDRLGVAFSMVREELVVFLCLTAIVLYLCAIGIYHFEHEAQPKQFASVFHSLWWAAVTLTTVGYGDVYPVTFGGRFFTVFVLFLGLGVVAVPTGLIASALSQLRREEKIDDSE